MPFSVKLFLTLLFVVSAVFGEDDEGQSCEDLLDNLEEHCCESVVGEETFDADFASCFDSDDVSCANFECLLDKQGIMKGHLIDEDVAKKHFEKIIKNQPENKSLVEQLQRDCLNGNFDKYSEKDKCPAADFFVCMFVNVHLACPKWKTSEVCTTMAANAKKCKQYVESL